MVSAHARRTATVAVSHSRTFRCLQTTGQLIFEGMNVFLSSTGFSIHESNWPLAYMVSQSVISVFLTPIRSKVHFKASFLHTSRKYYYASTKASYIPEQCE